MSLLKQKLIGVNTKWDACIKLCEDDDRWQLLKISDKKRYYQEYVNELKKVSDQEKRAKTEVSKNQFLKMLRESKNCLLYTSPSPRDQRGSRIPSSA